MLRFGKVVITPGFFLLLGISLFMGAAQVLPLVALAALLHEIGHLLVLRLFGVYVEGIYFTSFGAEIRANTRFLPYWKDIACTVAGPGMNLLAALLLSRLAGDYLLAGANLLQGCFNLLPLTGLDGSRTLHLLISWLFGPVCADRICRIVEIICVLLMAVCALYLVIYCGTGFFLMIALIGIFVSIWRDMRAK